MVLYNPKSWICRKQIEKGAREDEGEGSDKDSANRNKRLHLAGEARAIFESYLRKNIATSFVQVYS